jgi:PIN domain nuclease of toxin-antitoxin system
MQLLLDTQVLVWVAHGAPRIGRRTRSLIDRALVEDSALVSAVSFWEVARLVRLGRLKIASEPAAWRNRVLDAGFREVVLDGHIGVRAADISGMGGDPVDRFIVATALIRGAAVVTADQAILDWAGSLARYDASK